MMFSVVGIEIRSFGKKLQLMPEIRNRQNQGTLKRNNLDPMVNIPKNNNGNRQISKVD